MFTKFDKLHYKMAPLFSHMAIQKMGEVTCVYDVALRNVTLRA